LNNSSDEENSSEERIFSIAERLSQASRNVVMSKKSQEGFALLKPSPNSLINESTINQERIVIQQISAYI
jgi:hypothetical protein